MFFSLIQYTTTFNKSLSVNSSIYLRNWKSIFELKMTKSDKKKVGLENIKNNIEDEVDIINLV